MYFSREKKKKNPRTERKGFTLTVKRMLQRTYHQWKNISEKIISTFLHKLVYILSPGQC